MPTFTHYHAIAGFVIHAEDTMPLNISLKSSVFLSLNIIIKLKKPQVLKCKEKITVVSSNACGICTDAVLLRSSGQDFVGVRLRVQKKDKPSPGCQFYKLNLSRL